MRATAAGAGFGVECLGDIEYARRPPTAQEWAALDEFLQLGPPPEPVGVSAPAPRIRTSTLLRACQLLVLEGSTAIDDLAARVGVHEEDVGELLRRMQRRLAAVGVTARPHGTVIRLAALRADAEPTRRWTDDEREVLQVIRDRGPVTRAQLERLVAQRCEWRLRRLTRAGLLEVVADVERTGRPNLYEINDAGRVVLATDAGG